jgi:hypothetical protein
VSQRIAAELQAEFEAQAAREARLGLPVTVPLAATPAAKATLELGFIQFVVRPLYETLARVVPPLGECLPLIDANADAWRAIAAGGDGAA